MIAFDRLHRAGDLRAVFGARRVAHGPSMSVHARDRGDSGPGRATVVAGRQVGNAVARNRAKRRLRAALGRVTPREGLDVVVVGRAPAVSAEFPALVAEAERLLARAAERASPRDDEQSAPRPAQRLDDLAGSAR